MSTTRELFGGAISCSIPESFADVSDFRQVPDNQEVFADAQSDQCVIVELLQREAGVRDEDSARFFFNEVASANGCAPADVEERHAELLSAAVAAPLLGADNRAAAAVVSVVVGDQRVAKFREGDGAKNVVRVFLANIRLPSAATDVVLTVSVPLQINPASSSAGSFQFDNSAEVGGEVFQRAVQSFAMHDWSLFG
ncbi:hypothetical protein PybrP1_002060 [[Pythium] brassicae (nom. inval.)]|nr:hypothetical protein PybrP1_002060 [[Pythium] brassicae (nom. inval.)]